MLPDLQGFAIRGLPRIQPGDDLAVLIGDALASTVVPMDGDIITITSKVVSRAEGRFVALDSVEPGDTARSIAVETGKDPRLVELILRESSYISRKHPGVLIVRHRLGLVSANAAIDRSNVGIPDGAEQQEWVLLLPEDPDRSAARLHAALFRRFGLSRLGIVITDSFGRPFRRGTTGVAIGAAGIPVLDDQRGLPDLDGRTMEATLVAFADQVAAAAELLTGQGREGIPVTLLRGLTWPAGEADSASALCRVPEEDLYL
ncbi:MAG: coenzyme F420-0:L-glutamate ligase [Candidatus Dadabacteria bacterium]|nr:MAG: coenzyme F420-0:L-glutamate ligase [Candidatus Dadabacteria bacterium]